MTNNPKHEATDAMGMESQRDEGLKPCPFCGTTEGLYPTYHDFGGGKPFAIDCVGCGIDFTPRAGVDVIEAWNRRATTHPAHEAGEVERLSNALADLVSWFDKPVQGVNGPVWVITAGDQGADDAVTKARAALEDKS